MDNYKQIIFKYYEISLHDIQKNSKNTFSPDLKINDIQINQSSIVKYLGIQINDKLTWHDHIITIEKKLASALGIICKARYKLTQAATIKLYDTLFASHLVYGNIIWASTSTASLQKIYRLQKRLLKFCYSLLPLNNHSTPQITYFHIFNKLSIYGLNNLQSAKFIFQELYIFSHEHFRQMLQTNSELHKHNTRRNNNLFILNANTNLRKQTIIYHGINIWNSLPANIKNSRSIDCFSKLYKTYLLAH